MDIYTLNKSQGLVTWCVNQQVSYIGQVRYREKLKYNNAVKNKGIKWFTCNSKG